MRKSVLFLMFAALIASCVKKPVPEPKPDPIITKRLTTVEPFNVTTKSGYTTIVSLASDTLCMAVEPTTIWIPKNTQVATKADEASPSVTVSYIEGTDPAAGTSQLWQTIGFEDSTLGDYDYNDLVIHCKYEMKSQSGSYFLGIGVHPVALGSTKNIAVGCKIFIKDILFADEILSENCRNLFVQAGTEIEGFVNTGYTANFHTNDFRIKKVYNVGDCRNISDVKVVWYIKVDGNKLLYSVNDHYGYLNEGNRPYGIIITSTGRVYEQEDMRGGVGYNWFPYPYEGININDAYPTFNDWIEGRIEYCSMLTAVEGKAIDPGEYKYNRDDSGLTRVYYVQPSKTPFK